MLWSMRFYLISYTWLWNACLWPRCMRWGLSSCYNLLSWFIYLYSCISNILYMSYTHWYNEWSYVMVCMHKYVFHVMYVRCISYILLCIFMDVHHVIVLVKWYFMHVRVFENYLYNCLKNVQDFLFLMLKAVPYNI